MVITNAFTGGNISISCIDGDIIYLERELRDTEGDWFYWAFYVEGAQGRSLTFRFPNKARVGRFGAAVSKDFVNWSWTNTGRDDTFTYSFGADDDRIWFAHNMLYIPDRFMGFVKSKGLKTERFCVSQKGLDLPCLKTGGADDDKWVVMTARHHACESTGNYVLEGVLDEIIGKIPKGYSILVVPFMDYDGVINGDQGKNRKPYDHNRDYDLGGGDAIYDSVRCLREFAVSHRIAASNDFHSPWHMGAQNDYVFFSRSLTSMEASTDDFGELLKAETKDSVMKYTGEHDVGPNEAWNNEKTPCSKNWFGHLPEIRLSVTLETPYFGMPDSVTTQYNMLELGRAYGRAMLTWLNKH